MNVSAYIEKIKQKPNSIVFQETISIIDALYEFTPTAFYNDLFFNAPGQNSGSCKILAFAQLHNLTESETLACFGSYYFDDVLGTLEGSNHQNIRNFMKFGWKGIRFMGVPLKPKIFD